MIPLLAAIVPLIGTVVDRLVPDVEQASKLKAELAQTITSNAHDIVLAQIEVNKTEAAHKNLFVAGWRPAVGWVCAFGVAMVALQPIIAWAAALAGGQGALPEPDVELVLTLLGGLLGLGGMRTVEKIKRVARES